MPILDQDFHSGCCLTGILAEAYSYAGQSVTAGARGDLVRVELAASHRADFVIPWLLDIQEVVSGVPTGKVLSSTLIDADDFTLIGGFDPKLLVELSSPVFFEIGDEFAIVLHPQGIEGFAPSLFAGSWNGDVNAGYSGGTAFFGASGSALVAESYDFHFKTFVSQVPEPSSALLLVAGLAALRRRGRGSLV